MTRLTRLNSRQDDWKSGADFDFKSPNKPKKSKLNRGEKSSSKVSGQANIEKLKNRRQSILSRLDVDPDITFSPTIAHRTRRQSLANLSTVTTANKKSSIPRATSDILPSGKQKSIPKRKVSPLSKAAKPPLPKLRKNEASDLIPVQTFYDSPTKVSIRRCRASSNVDLKEMSKVNDKSIIQKENPSKKLDARVNLFNNSDKKTNTKIAKSPKNSMSSKKEKNLENESSNKNVKSPKNVKPNKKSLSDSQVIAKISTSPANFKAKAKKLESSKAKSPKDSKVKAKSPKDSKLKAKNPKDSKVKAKSPKDFKLNAKSPKDSKVKAKSPKDVKVKAKSPKNSKVDVKSPVNSKDKNGKVMNVTSTPLTSAILGVSRLTRSVVKSNKKVKVNASSPVSSSKRKTPSKKRVITDDSFSGSAAKKIKSSSKKATNTPGSAKKKFPKINKSIPFTPKPEDPQQLLRITMKKKIADDVKALKKMTSMVELPNLTNPEIVSVRKTSSSLVRKELNVLPKVSSRLPLPSDFLTASTPKSKRVDRVRSRMSLTPNNSPIRPFTFKDPPLTSLDLSNLSETEHSITEDVSDTSLTLNNSKNGEHAMNGTNSSNGSSCADVVDSAEKKTMEKKKGYCLIM